MITIKDSALGRYSVAEDFQGFKVLDENGKVLVKANTFEEALRYVAQRLTLDVDATYTLAEYTRMRQQVFDTIVAAQQNSINDSQQTIPFEEVNNG